ncbi:MAG TPA: hypothetical protein VMM76_20165 [Pirellulaceae bacterium]|nr:hypothetical protein [Pirellulaceae bacterium]
MKNCPFASVYIFTELPLTQSLDQLKKIETQAKAAKRKTPGKKTPKKKAEKMPKGKKRSDD